MSQATPDRPVIFISAAEQSADQHAAELIRATLARRPDIQFVGVAGPRMVEAGCEAIFDMTRHAGMLLGVIGAARHAMRMMRTSKAYIRDHKLAAAVVVDSPALHLKLAGILAPHAPVLYFIAPQLWAWGEKRMTKLRERARRVACLLPFEEPYFREHGIDATFVGHPTVEKLEAQIATTAASWPAAGAPKIALLPGSRTHVVREVLEGQLEVAASIRQAHPHASFAVSVANAQAEPIVRKMVGKSGLADVAITERHLDLVRAADLVLVASGTTTLEVACFRKPMIVMYNASRLLYQFVARRMIKTPHLSLPNILAGRQIVPEFMPYYASTEPIAAAALELLNDGEKRKQMVADLDEIITPLEGSRASERTADLLLAMLD